MATPFQTEAWTEYGIGMLILIFRVIVRTRQIGFHWEGDDYFTILAIVFFTVELCMLELIGQNGTIVGMTDEVALTLTQEQKDKLVLGSKLLLVGWITYTTLIWCLKGCLLFFYNRLTYVSLRIKNFLTSTNQQQSQPGPASFGQGHFRYLHSSLHCDNHRIPHALPSSP
jgi:hypothetical protein